MDMFFKSLLRVECLLAHIILVRTFRFLLQMRLLVYLAIVHRLLWVFPKELSSLLYRVDSALESNFNLFLVRRPEERKISLKPIDQSLEIELGWILTAVSGKIKTFCNLVRTQAHTGHLGDLINIDFIW